MTAIACGDSSSSDRLRWIRVPRSTCAMTSIPKPGADVDEQGEVDPVARREGQLLEDLAASRVLAGERLHDRREVREEQRHERTSDELGDPCHPRRGGRRAGGRSSPSRTRRRCASASGPTSPSTKRAPKLRMSASHHTMMSPSAANTDRQSASPFPPRSSNIGRTSSVLTTRAPASAARLAVPSTDRSSMTRISSTRPARARPARAGRDRRSHRPCPPRRGQADRPRSSCRASRRRGVTSRSRSSGKRAPRGLARRHGPLPTVLPARRLPWNVAPFRRLTLLCTQPAPSAPLLRSRPRSTARSADARPPLSASQSQDRVASRCPGALREPISGVLVFTGAPERGAKP